MVESTSALRLDVPEPAAERDDVAAIGARIRSVAADLLRGGTVSLVIGYSAGRRADAVAPCFVAAAEDADLLVYTERCTHNLARYLVGADGWLTAPYRTVHGKPRIAVVARPATLRAITGLIQENQVQREDLVILGITDGTAAGVAPDVEVGRVPVDEGQQDRVQEQIALLEAMSAEERWDWWEQQFSRCLRCYACREVCPFCYCEQCLADQNQPQWIERSSSPASNRVWNTIRAFHLVGRCIGCGECDRVCPADIPLSVLNTKMRAEIEQAFGYVAGIADDVPPPLFDFRANDPDGFVR